MMNYPEISEKGSRPLRSSRKDAKKELFLKLDFLRKIRKGECPMFFSLQNKIFNKLLTVLITALSVGSLAAIELNEISQQIEKTAKLTKEIDNVFLDSDDDEKISSIQKEIIQLGPPAITHLLDLLQHKDLRVRQITINILGEMKGLSDAQVDTLARTNHEGIHWQLSRALAEIGTAHSISYLLDRLKKDEFGAENSSYAFMLLGKKGVPYLLSLLRENPSNALALRNAQELLGYLGTQADSAIPPLLEIMSDENLPIENRRHAILSLAPLTKDPHTLVPIFQALAEKNPSAFKPIVETALVIMEVPESLDILVRQLHKNPNLMEFRAIARLGKYGKPAGSKLIPYLNHDDWDVKIGAARTMGLIAYEPAIPPLIKLLQNREDWRLIFVAVESLAELNAKESLAPLKELAQNHWYPAVRKVAEKALLSITNGENNIAPEEPNDIDSCFSRYAFARGRSKQNKSPLDKTQLVKAKRALSAKELKNLKYEITIDTYSIEGKVVRKRKVVPNVGIKLHKGYLLGSSRGEWGGELIYMDENGKSLMILEENIQGIYHYASEIVVVTGLAHMSSNRGTIYKVSQDKRRNWMARKWRALPGAPVFSSMLKDGSLYVQSYFNRNIILKSDGNIRMIGDRAALSNKTNGN
ncbi:MAG: HEAT repeat domain-containing protein [Verrucomicrobiales bacterium]|nr:HEAT repeat domain-containing protein [Verrucomicrobiales bacterium]